MIVDGDIAASQRLADEIRNDARFILLPPQTNAKKALMLGRRERPAVIIQDLYPDGSISMDTMAKFRQLLPHAKILIRTDCQQIEPLLMALRLGCDGILLKQDQSTRMTDALACLLDGQIQLSVEVIRLIHRHIRNSFILVGNDRMTERQRLVLQMVADGKMDKEIANVLRLSVDRIKKHIAELKTILGATTRTDLARRTIPQTHTDQCQLNQNLHQSAIDSNVHS